MATLLENIGDNTIQAQFIDTVQDEAVRVSSKHGDLPTVQFILSKSKQNVFNRLCCEGFSNACFHTQLSVAKYLISIVDAKQKKEMLFLKDKQGGTFFENACDNGDSSFVRLFLEEATDEDKQKLFGTNYFRNN